MNSRSTQWRQKPTIDIQNMIPLAQEIRLYMVQELGPTSFVFKDENDNKLRISIGREISCTCNPHKKDQCVHTLYVFLKIFQFEKDNPLIWQASYIDSEIEEMIRNRYNPRSAPKTKKILPRLQKRSTSVGVKTRNPGVVTRLEVDENDVCCICHENMREDEGLTYCKKKCGNNFHLKCIMIWAEHKNTTGEKINCPMCRADWGMRAFDNLKDELEEFESRAIMHKGHKCSACKSYGQKCIKGKLFHCMYCENYELCEKCFLSFEHFEHNKYLVKENANDTWKPAKPRESVYIKNHDKTYKFAKEISNLDKIPGVDYRIALLNMNLANYDDHSDDKQISDQLCVDMENSVEMFLVSCFPDFGSEFDLYQGRTNALSIVGREVRKTCCYCQTDKGSNFKLKRLFCGHLMHDRCLMELFSKKMLTCPEDGLELLKGLRMAYYPNMPYSPPVLIEKYQQKVNEGKSPVNQHLIESKKHPQLIAGKQRKPVTPQTKLTPLELDVKGKNVVRIPKPQVDSQLTTDRYSFLKNDKKGIGKKFLKPPKGPLQVFHKKEIEYETTKDMSPMIGILGTSIPTSGSFTKLDVRKKDMVEFKPYDELMSSLYDDEGKRMGIGGRHPSYIPDFWETNSDEHDSSENRDVV